MLKVNLKNANDLSFFLEVNGAKCYALLNEGVVLFDKDNIKNYYYKVVDTITLFRLNATLEYTEDNNFFIDVYLDGIVRESNSLTHINTIDDLSMNFDE